MTPTFQLIPIDQVHESPVNIRRHIDAAGLRELVASVTQRGVITPLLLRPIARGTAVSKKGLEGYEIAAGHRRYRASLAAGLSEVPALVRAMDDAEFMEVLITENLQRADVHPMDEAIGYEALQKADKLYTPEAIAAKVGKSVSYVYQRLKLLNLNAECRKAFEENRILAAHAVRLARLPKELQKRALEQCTVHDMFRDSPDEEVTEPAPVSRLDSWIASNFKTEIAAPDTPHYFPELADDLAVEASTLLQLSESHTPGANLGTQKHGTIGHARWTEIRTAKDECKFVRKGVVVHGGPMRILRVCAEKECPKHRPKRRALARPAAKGETPEARAKREAKEAADRRQRELAEARRETVETRAFDEALGRVAATLTPALLRRTVLELLRGDVDQDAFRRRFGIKVHWIHELKDLKQLQDVDLPRAIVFCLLSAVLMDGDDKSVAEAFALLDVDVKRIDKEVAAEQAEQERAAGFDDKKPGAKKRKGRTS